MSWLEVALRVTGAGLIGLAVLHVPFAKRFEWKAELARLSLLNRQIFYVHCLFLCLVLAMVGGLCAFAPGALLERTALGGWVAAGLAFFWFCRLVVQWCVFDWRLWRGKRFETGVHIVFTVGWIFFTGVFGAVAWEQWR